MLALGLPRTGTDSLKQALQILGYDHVYHGFDIFLDAPNCLVWSQLAAKKRSGKTISSSDFDEVLGHYEAVTDQPCCLFGSDLIEAYPDARIILNRRKDVDDWYRSLMAITGIIESWSGWARSLVGAEEFWIMRTIKVGWIAYFRGDYRKNGKEVYEQHY